MPSLREAATQALEAKQVPLRELLASVPADARLVIHDADGKGTRSIPVGRLCHEAAAALAEPVQDGCDHCNSPLYAAIKCRVCGRVAEPVQEPVAWKDKTYESLHHQDFGNSIPLYTAPPQRKPLTEEEIYSLFRTVASPVMFARAIERAHGIGGDK